MNFDKNEGKFPKKQIVTREIVKVEPRPRESIQPVQKVQATQSAQPIPMAQSAQPVQMVQSRQPIPMAQPSAIPRFIPTIPFNFVSIATAGITYNSALDINRTMALSMVRINEHFAKKGIDFSFKHQEKLMNSDEVTYGADIIPIVSSKLDLAVLARDFIYDFSVVKIRSNVSRDGWIYMVRDLEDNKHVPKDKTELYQEWENYVWDNINDDQECEDSKIKIHGRRMLHNIESLEKSSLKKLDSTQLMFSNGYYDLKSDLLVPLDAGERYFNRFSMLYDFHLDMSEPVVFNAVLADMFNGNGMLINLAYEFIGAILFPVSTLKKIYVFQGVSNGGKSRLANIIARLMNERDIRIFNGLEGINSEFLKKEAPFCRLVYIRDAADKKMAAIPCSNLKGFADGSDLNDSAAFKILICTNNKITTGDNGYIAPSLVNRFAVLPFPKPMDNIDENIVNFENYHFEREKNQILNKAFRAFQKVLLNGSVFSTNVPINSCVEANNIERNEQNKDFVSKMDYILDSMFILTDQAVPQMTTDTIINAINQFDTSLCITPATLGRELKRHFGDNLIADRNSYGMYYNLALKTNQ